MKTISEDSIAITNRFFEAIGLLKANKQIRGIEDFAERYGLRQCYLSDIKNHSDKRSIKVEYLMYLVRDFNVSATWLLLGVGNKLN